MNLLIENKRAINISYVITSPDQLDNEITKILKMEKKSGEILTIKERIFVINWLMDTYIIKFGEAPKGNQIQRLANWLLLENLKNTHPDKVTREEYPIMTKRQLRARYRREMANENIPDTYTTLSYLSSKKNSIAK